MKTIKLLPVTMLALLISFNSFSQSATEDAKQVFSKALESFNNGDRDAYLNYVAEDFQGYAGVHSPFLFESKAEWVTFIKGMDNLAGVNYTQRDANWRNFGPRTVIGNAYFTFTTVTKNGEVNVQNGRETAIMIKVNDSWKIVNLHFSPIF